MASGLRRELMDDERFLTEHPALAVPATTVATALTTPDACLHDAASGGGGGGGDAGQAAAVLVSRAAADGDDDGKG